ncbi:hypothetical protein CSUB_C1105 [Candidatus Caldarchaeum subterraneum]|uniref:Uncharacterized protein n=1 Tax=Caldiarchaeum subterraneum TaxID=311458 RepID=E6N418_CALS0|nr:hypothetical protein HGMM_F55C09C33 [Candidatus Caldarchaeum subterraneum]BAJ50957.1 hypothetical protein CSUB_C1105 [Candidatus Caldarchaeum subterraneum]
MSELKKIMEEISELKKRIERLEDAILTEDDLEAIEEAEMGYEEGKTFSLEEARKRLLDEV